MSRVTSKLQVTIPKAIAERHGIRPGDEIDWQSGGDAFRVVVDPAEARPDVVNRRLRLFDGAARRQEERDRQRQLVPAPTRGWTRDKLHHRGRAG